MLSEILSDITLRFGVNDRVFPESWSTIRSVSDIYIHEDYNPYMNWENDIALLKLSVNKKLVLNYIYSIVT